MDSVSNVTHYEPFEEMLSASSSVIYIECTSLLSSCSDVFISFTPRRDFEVKFRID